jgi:hypothetical protein
MSLQLAPPALLLANIGTRKAKKSLESREGLLSIFEVLSNGVMVMMSEENTSNSKKAWVLNFISLYHHL